MRITKGNINMKRNILITTLLVAATSMIGCNKTQSGAAFGALAGQAIGKDTKGTLIGAGIGMLIGNMADESQRQQDAGKTTRHTTTKRVLNSDGTYSTVGQETTTSTETVDGYQSLP